MLGAVTSDSAAPAAPEATFRRPAIDQCRPILVRPSGDVQIGWDPETALIITPPDRCSADTVAQLLRSLDGTQLLEEVVRAAERAGITRTAFMMLLSQLRESGALADCAARRAVAPPDLAVVGQGPIANVLLRALPELGTRVTQFTTPSQQRTQLRLLRLRPFLTVLTDAALVNPALNDFLVREHLPHLAARVRDGRALVGPLVLPGVTSCLRCADLYRTDRDPEWPHLAAQLTGSVPHANPAAVYAAAGYALSQIELVLAATHRRQTPIPPAPPAPPATLGTTVEIDPREVTMTARGWPRHPLCVCWANRPAPRGNSAA